MSESPDFSPEAIAEAASTPDEVRAALAEATPGPWSVAPGGRDGIWCADGTERIDAYMDEADAHLIVNAPTWRAQLLAALEASEKERDRINALNEGVTATHAKWSHRALTAEAALEASERERERLREALNELANLAAEAVTPCDVASGWCCAHHMDATSVVPCDVAQLADALPRLAAALTPSTPPDLREDT